jgi:hypothetical protein
MLSHKKVIILLVPEVNPGLVAKLPVLVPDVVRTSLTPDTRDRQGLVALAPSIGHWCVSGVEVISYLKQGTSIN